MMRQISATLIFVFALGMALASGATIRSPYRSPRHSLRHTRVRLEHWNPVLRGSHDSMLRQNEEIDRLKLTRINDDQDSKNLNCAVTWSACTIQSRCKLRRISISTGASAVRGHALSSKI